MNLAARGDAMLLDEGLLLVPPRGVELEPLLRAEYPELEVVRDLPPTPRPTSSSLVVPRPS